MNTWPPNCKGLGVIIVIKEQEENFSLGLNAKNWAFSEVSQYSNFSAKQSCRFISVVRRKLEHMTSQLPKVLLKEAIIVIKEQTNSFFSRSECEKVDIFRGIAVFSRQGVVELPHLPLRDKESFSKRSTSNLTNYCPDWNKIYYIPISSRKFEFCSTTRIVLFRHEVELNTWPPNCQRCFWRGNNGNKRADEKIFLSVWTRKSGHFPRYRSIFSTRSCGTSPPPSTGQGELQ